MSAIIIIIIYEPSKEYLRKKWYNSESVLGRAVVKPGMHTLVFDELRVQPTLLYLSRILWGTLPRVLLKSIYFMLTAIPHIPSQQELDDPLL